jgi:type I restriction enzyme M protein
MIDARNIYRKVTRKIYDFTPEQLDNINAIVWLYRGQSDRFLALVRSYLDRTNAEAASIAGPVAALRKSYDALTSAAASFLKTLPKDAPLRDVLKGRDEAALACFQSLDKLAGYTEKLKKESWATHLAAQKKRLAELEPLATACRGLVKEVDLVFNLAARLVDAAESDAEAREHEAWDSRAIGRLKREFDERRREAVEQLKTTVYFERQAHWLLSRFPDAEFLATPGLCRAVTCAEIKAADWSLTPGRYVGIASPEVDEDFDFEQTLREIHIELADLNHEAANLAATIHTNFEALGL